MFDLVLFLVTRYLSDLLGCQEGVLVYRCEDPADLLETQSFCDAINFLLVRVIKWCDTVDLADLGRLIKGLDVYSHSFRVVRVLRVVAIEPRHALLHAAALALPEIDEALHLSKVHEADVVNVAESLSLQHGRLRQALVAHPLGEGLVVGAIVVDLIAERLEGHTVLALLVCLVLSFALGLDL